MASILLRFCLLLPLLWADLAAADDGGVQPVPPFNGYVTDLAGALTPEQQQALSARLTGFAEQKGSQVAVLIVHTTAPEDIASYSFRIADHWKLGRKGVDDGVLLVLAVDEHKDNIQVGYGLEGALPDVTAKRILQDIMAPHLRQGDTAGGITAGVDAIIKVINGEALPVPQQQRHSRQQGSGSFVPGLIAGVFIAIFLQSLLGRAVGGIAGGAAGGFAAFVLGGGIAAALGVGTLVAVVVWLGLLSGRGGGGFYGGGFGGGGFGGGGFGGSGGFGGGGGGSFGGGGASGNW